jgi:uncharacterized protein (DUF58 family)
MFRTSSSAVHGPGDFTLTAVVLFTLGAYGVAAGAVTGDQTVVAIGVFAFSLFAVGVVWPIVTLARLGIEVVAPPDATVGDEVPLHVTLRGKAARIEVRVLDPPSRWWRTPVPAGGTLPHLATRRGVFDHVRVQIRTAAPLGVFVRVRQARVPLPEPIAVAPRPRPAAAHLRPIPDDAALAHRAAAVAGGSDVVRAVRPYVAGDPARLVHWPTSARLGDLVVREHDPPGANGVALVVDLSGPEEWADEAAAHAAGLARSTLAGGGAVVLSTRERGGPVCGPVDSVRELGRRLARAVSGPPAPAPPGWPVQTVRAADVGFPA